MTSSETDISPGGTDAASQPEAKKPDKEILAEELREGRKALELPFLGLLLSGLSAGLDIGFSILLMATALTILGEFESLKARVVIALCYSVGFIFVVLGRSELFTEHTTLATLPVLDRKASIRSLTRLWVIVYITNAVGVVAFAWLATEVGRRLHIASAGAFSQIGLRVVIHSGMTIFFSAVLAGWLMGLLSWLVAAARDTIGQIIIVALVTTSIGFMTLHHSIVGTGEVAAAMFAGARIDSSQLIHFMLWATIGNALGGTVFVALLKYGRVMLAKAPGEIDES